MSWPPIHIRTPRVLSGKTCFLRFSHFKFIEVIYVMGISRFLTYFKIWWFSDTWISANDLKFIYDEKKGSTQFSEYFWMKFIPSLPFYGTQKIELLSHWSKFSIFKVIFLHHKLTLCCHRPTKSCIVKCKTNFAW